MAENYEFKDNSTVIIDKLKNVTQQSTSKMAKDVVDAIQYQILYGYKDRHGSDGHTEIVETGALFDSIKAEVKKVSQNALDITAGSDKDYAVFVHNGTRKLKGRPFITDGINKARHKIIKRFKASYENA